jgi:hypothetical protein
VITYAHRCERGFAVQQQGDSQGASYRRERISRGTGPDPALDAEDSGYSLCALRYAVITEAGTLPRSLTIIPCWRAHERTSAFLGEPAAREAVLFLDASASTLVAGAAGRAFLAADGFLVAFLF